MERGKRSCESESARKSFLKVREERENREGKQTNCNTCTQSHNIQGVARDLSPLSIAEDKITIRLHITTKVSSS